MIAWLLSATLLAAAFQPDAPPAWSEGVLEIHQISTGRGNAAFMIFPDGTTLLLDAGDAGDSIPHTEARPDSSRRAGEWIARYIRARLPANAPAKLDYAVLTHFHADHMGRYGEDLPVSRHGDYRLSGITEVAEELVIDTVLDRGWPDYQYPTALDFPAIDNYRRFLEVRSRDGLRVERFQPGRKDQIVARRNPAAYPAFEVRNVAANGEVWTGVGKATRHHFPELETLAEPDYPTENMCSLALQIRYGKFDYYAGGDQPGVVDTGGPAWNDLETPIARAVGPVDAMVVHHHGSIDPANPFLLAAMRPRVVVLPTWAAGHPAPGVLKRLLSERLYPGPRDIFATGILPPTAAVIGGRIEQLKSRSGHVMIRVAPGGETYQVWILDDSTESPRPLAVHGPYPSR